LYLKKIEIKGFKSFADKVEIELDKGITGIVGPNGSGKSNISDAVRWVLGEQSAKSLRGGKMEDVIFAGTVSRKPLGFSEVSITIDNEDNMLPIDYSEVTVTRRMYRSGESEYYINKTECRLKDITELFMDTGVGKDGYSIIGQGKIDEILNAKPENRREIFEEAAGIVKYKTRKIESERKLNTTEQNIIRLDDIINELETQLDPLYNQSQEAKRYLDLREKLKILDINLSLRNLEKLKEKIGTIDENYKSLEDELKDNSRKSGDLEKEYGELRLKLHQIDKDIEETQNLLFATNSEIDKYQGEVKVLNEKIININNNIKRLEEEINREKLKAEKYETSTERNTKELNNLRNLLEEKLKLLEEKSALFEKVSGEISSKTDYIENMKSEVIELLNLIADKKSSVNSYATFKSGIEKRKTQISVEKENIESEIKGLQKSLEKTEKEISDTNRKIELLVSTLKELEMENASALEQKKLIDAQIYNIKGRIQSKQARYRMLREMETEFEGYNKSVKEIMKLKNSQNLLGKGVCGTVADIIKVPQRYEVAVEVALGASLQNIVTEDEETAKKCIEFLKQNMYGRATFLPLTTVKSKGQHSVINLRNMPGFIGFGSDLIEYDDRYSDIIWSLLGRVIIVDVMDNAIAIARKINFSMKIVTLDGDIISPGGAFTGGSINQKTGRILSRKREIEELSKELKELSKNLQDENERLRKNEILLKGIEERIKAAVEEKHSAEITVASWKNKYNQGEIDIKRLQTQLSELDNELLQLDSEGSEIIEKIERESRELGEYEEKSSMLSDKVQREQDNIKDVLQVKEVLSSEITSLKIKAAEYRGEIASLESKAVEIASSLKSCRQAIEEKLQEKQEALNAIERLAEEIKSMEEAISRLEEKKAICRSKLDSLQSQKREASIASDEIESKRKEYGETSQILQGEINKLEIQKAKLVMEMENIQNRMWDDYQVTPAAAAKYKTEIESLAQASRDINALKEEIRSLGNVNVGAIDEYKRVKDRYEFLTKQKRDLEEAKDSLKKVIVEMEESMREKFSKNFAIIKENFNEVFRELFGGGKAELILCDEENILESGIDIIAQPPGKKLQNLTLLSGGEKALTAIALLFAILKMKPSPFCILDEIEAALDDANVARYGKFLKEFSKQTQFIIVTHRKGSMEVSDALYGVTMEEEGVSRLVSVKLSGKAS